MSDILIVVRESLYSLMFVHVCVRYKHMQIAKDTAKT